MKHFSIIFTLLFGAGMLTGCAARWVRTPVVDQRDMTVSLEHKIADKQVADQQFNHPFNIDAQNLRTLLSQLEYMAEPMIYGKPEQKPVFQAVEIDRLVPALAEALSKADANQRVRFVSYNRGGGLLFKKRRRTSGVAFVRPGNHLNLAFADVNFEILTNEMENISRGDEFPDPLRIKSSYTPIVAPDYIEHALTKKPAIGVRLGDARALGDGTHGRGVLRTGHPSHGPHRSAGRDPPGGNAGGRPHRRMP